MSSCYVYSLHLIILECTLFYIFYNNGESITHTFAMFQNILLKYILFYIVMIVYIF